VREPQDERDAKRTDERRGENSVDRAHVRDDRAAAKPRELAGQRRLEPRAAEGFVRGAEGAHTAILGQHPFDGAVGEHDDLVHVRGQRTDLRHGRRKRGVTRIDLLRDEDELAH